MIVLHVEDLAITRKALKRLLRESEGRVGDHEYVATGIPAAAKQRLRNNEVKVMILDLNLDNDWAKANRLPSLLKEAVQNPAGWRPPSGFQAYEIALLAKQHQVPFAIMTNYADQLGVEVSQALQGLTKAFQANIAFTKDEAGLEACAGWVRDLLHIPRQPNPTP